MTTESETDWQLQHYANAGKSYGKMHFTQAEGDFTSWILNQISSVHPAAMKVAEVGAGTCVFASMIGKKLGTWIPVTCYEPVAGLLEASSAFENINAVCGGAVEFGRAADRDQFDLIYTKDTAHHFPEDSLDAIHHGFCAKLSTGGRYAMIVRSPPKHDVVPVGEIAARKWSELYTPVETLLESLRGGNCLEGNRDDEVGASGKNFRGRLAGRHSKTQFLVCVFCAYGQ